MSEDGSTNVIGWLLRADSDSGGKIYAIAIVDKKVVYGWGRESASIIGAQTKTETLRTREQAIRFAQTKTAEKEKRGYRLDKEPRTLRLEAGDARLLQWHVKVLLHDLMRDGEPI